MSHLSDSKTLSGKSFTRLYYIQIIYIAVYNTKHHSEMREDTNTTVNIAHQWREKKQRNKPLVKCVCWWLVESFRQKMCIRPLFSCMTSSSSSLWFVFSLSCKRHFIGYCWPHRGHASSHRGHASFHQADAHRGDSGHGRFGDLQTFTA